MVRVHDQSVVATLAAPAPAPAVPSRASPEVEPTASTAAATAARLPRNVVARKGRNTEPTAAMSSPAAAAVASDVPPISPGLPQLPWFLGRRLRSSPAGHGKPQFAVVMACVAGDDGISEDDVDVGVEAATAAQNKKAEELRDAETVGGPQRRQGQGQQEEADGRHEHSDGVDVAGDRVDVAPTCSPRSLRRQYVIRRILPPQAERSTESSAPGPQTRGTASGGAEKVSSKSGAASSKARTDQAIAALATASSPSHSTPAGISKSKKRKVNSEGGGQDSPKKTATGAGTAAAAAAAAAIGLNQLGPEERVTLPSPEWQCDASNCWTTAVLRKFHRQTETRDQAVARVRLPTCPPAYLLACLPACLLACLPGMGLPSTFLPGD